MKKAAIFASIVLLLLSCGEDKENNIKIVLIDPNENITAGVPQLFNIEIEYTLSTDELGYIWVGFNTDKTTPNRFPTSKSYTINKGSGKVLFTETVTPIDWSGYGSSFSVMVTLSAYNDGKLGDVVVDKKIILK